MKATIIGGGIIGLCSAYYLRKDGWDVTIIDKTDLSDNCSYGNLGMIVPSHFVPLAAPGIVSQGIRWMFNAKSPFYVKPSLSMNLISWGLKFLKSANARNVESAAVPLRDINLLSKGLYEELKDLPGFDFSFEKKGIMMYYKTEHVAEEEIHLAEKARSMGLDAVALSREEVKALEPQMDPDVLGAVHYKCDAHIYPNALNRQLVQWLRENGVKFVTGTDIRKIVVEGSFVKKVVTDKEEIATDVLVAAAGSWLPEITRMAGVSIPLMPGKGYSFTLESPEKALNIPAILCEARVAITPMGGRMRYGGTMELGAVNNKVNMTRVQGIVESVPAYFPGLELKMPAEKDVWHGFRPCSPDGIPYIGASRKVSNLLIAGGHAMMGLSLGPATGKLIAELAGHKPTSIPVAAFDPERFG